MNLRLLLLLALGAASAAPVARAFTYESPTELFLNADLDGNGLDDAVIVDRASGAYRIGYQTSPGAYNWVAARPSGITNVTWAATGRMLSLSMDSLALTAADANRVNVFAADDMANPALPVSAYPDGFDLSVVVSLNTPIPPVTVFDDLIAASTSSPSNPDSVTILSSTGADFTFAADNPSLGAWKRGNRAELKVGGAHVAAVMVAHGASDNFRADSFNVGTGLGIAGLDGFPVDTTFVYGQFAGATLNQFLFYTAGASNLTENAVLEPVPGSFTFTAAASYPIGASIGQVFVIQDAVHPRLLLIVNNGAEARVYNYDGVNPPVLLQAVQASAGQSFTGATPLAGGDFHLLRGAAGSGLSSQWTRYGFNGSKYVATASGSLPSVNAQAISANVFLFANEPFVSANPGLLRQLNAADWSSKPVLAGGKVTVNAEHFAGAAAGLRSPAPRVLGAIPIGASYALANQYQPAISVASFLPAIGSEPNKMTITPSPGPQKSAAKVTITQSNPFYTIYYSQDGGPWTPYNTPFWIYRTTSIRYAAQAFGPGALKTQTRTATYTFDTDPSYADSDHDGVPDFVEIAYGLDPTAGADSDADGFGDKNEILAGTNPADPSSHPPAGSQLDELAAFDLLSAPRAFDGTASVESDPILGLKLGLYDLTGGLIEPSYTTNTPAAGFNVSARFTNVLASLIPPLFTAATPDTFAIVTGNSDTNLGRETLGIFVGPQVAIPPVHYTLGNGSLAAEAANWVAAAQAAQATQQHPVVAGAFGVDETLAALLLERKVNHVLADRGVGSFNATNLTLFHFRPNDSQRYAPTFGQLKAISVQQDAAHPGYDLGAVHQSILDNVTTNPAYTSLRALAFDVYGVSSRSNNIAPGAYPLPVDVLRDFLISGVLHSNYAAASLLTPAHRADASTGEAALLNSLGGRPVAMFSMMVTSNSFPPNDVQLTDTATGFAKHLFAGPGVFYKFPNEFELLPGAMLRVVAYTDFSDPNYPTNSLQVISATLLSEPPTPVQLDLTGLLPLSWEELFFGGPVNPFADSDGDGVSNLQEFLDGTDPSNPGSHGAMAVNLSLPTLKIEPSTSPGMSSSLMFSFPEAYANRFQFTVQSAADLGMPFVNLAFTPVPDGHGNLLVSLPAVQDAAGFYRLLVQLQ